MLITLDGFTSRAYRVSACVCFPLFVTTCDCHWHRLINSISLRRSFVIHFFSLFLLFFGFILFCSVWMQSAKYRFIVYVYTENTMMSVDSHCIQPFTIRLGDGVPCTLCWCRALLFSLAYGLAQQMANRNRMRSIAFDVVLELWSRIILLLLPLCSLYVSNHVSSVRLLCCLLRGKRFSLPMPTDDISLFLFWNEYVVRRRRRRR